MNDMTDVVRDAAALAWLEILTDSPYEHERRHARTIKAMLAVPGLPHPSDWTTADYEKLGMELPSANFPVMTLDHVKKMVASLHRHLTRPKTKTVEAWRLDYAIRFMGAWQPRSFTGTKAEVEHEAEGLKNLCSHACIRVTGPFKQEIPA